MREIKFRAWDNDKGMSWPFDFRVAHPVWPDGSTMPYWSTLAVIEQFTGLHDKNGVEIYEGDIVSPVEPLQGGVNGMAIVKYEDGGFSPFAVPGWEVVARPKAVAVIGNIHENPEELK